MNVERRSKDVDSERRIKLFLLGGGSVIGILFGCLVGLYIHHAKAARAMEGSHFNNLNDFRRAMLGHDERDTLPDDNVSLRTIVQPDDSDLVIYRLKAGLSVKFQNVPVRTNSFGMRGPETTVEKPLGVFRIALLGDSFAFGWGVEEDKTFARVMERELSKVAPNGQRVEVLNFAVPGYSTFQEVASFEQSGLRFHPDAVVVYWVENDFGLPFFIKDLEKPGELARDSDFATLKAREQDPTMSAANQELLKNLDPNRSLARLAKSSPDQGFRMFVALNPGQRADKDEKRLWSRHMKQITMLHLRPEVKAIVEQRGLTHEQLQLKGDPHPSAVKHEILGQVLAKQLAASLWNVQ